MPATIACRSAQSTFTPSMPQRCAEVVRTHGHEAATCDLYRIGFDPVLHEEERLGFHLADIEKAAREMVIRLSPAWQHPAEPAT